MKDRRARRRHRRWRIREAKLLELLAHALDAIRIRGLQVELDEDRLDETGVAALVHARERPAHDAWRVSSPRPFLSRGGQSDEFRRETALADTRLPRAQR